MFNLLADFLIFLLISLFSLGLLRLLQVCLTFGLKKIFIKSNFAVKYNFDFENSNSLLKIIFLPFYFYVLYICFDLYNLFPQYKSLLKNILILIFIFSLLRLLTMLMDHALKNYWHNKLSIKNIGVISTFINTVVWIVGLLLLMDNFGIKISAVITGLGIGGVAVALAAQKFLGDLFSYFSIFLDKPFEEGDFIIVQDVRGTVENIGLKTTRIRSQKGEEVVFSNSELINSVIHNYKKMKKRRVSFQFGLVYQTPIEKLKQIPNIVKEVFDSITDADLERIHFSSFGDYSLIFECVYYVNSPDYNLYMDIQQLINYRLKERFENLGIEFAYPTNTIFLNRIS